MYGTSRCDAHSLTESRSGNVHCGLGNLSCIHYIRSLLNITKSEKVQYFNHLFKASFLAARSSRLPSWGGISLVRAGPGFELNASNLGSLFLESSMGWMLNSFSPYEMTMLAGRRWMRTLRRTCLLLLVFADIHGVI